MDLYNYEITSIQKVVDGDTVYVNVSLGFDVKYLAKVRLKEIDTPELNSKDEAERELAKDYKTFVSNLLLNAMDYEKPLYLQSKSRGKYGRWIGDIVWEGQRAKTNFISTGKRRV